VIALTAGMFGGVSLLWGLIRVMVYMGKKGQVDALKAEIAAIEAQLRQLRSQIH